MSRLVTPPTNQFGLTSTEKSNAAKRRKMLLNVNSRVRRPVNQAVVAEAMSLTTKFRLSAVARIALQICNGKRLLMLNKKTKLNGVADYKLLVIGDHYYTFTIKQTLVKKAAQRVMWGE